MKVVFLSSSVCGFVHIATNVKPCFIVGVEALTPVSPAASRPFLLYLLPLFVRTPVFVDRLFSGASKLPGAVGDNIAKRGTVHNHS
jgi:hypothetical protein